LHSRLCGIPESKFSVLYNGVEVPDSPANAASRSDGQFRILFVGRLARQKRPQDLVQAVTQLPAELLQRTCVDILGAGELELELRNAIAASGLEDRVHLHGYQSDVEPWWATADLLVLPSAWEGLPNVVLEAMTHRVPVIAASVDGVREVIEHDETGWLVESGNVAGLTAAIVRAELSLEDRNQVAVRAFESVCQRFCWQKSIEAFACRLSELHHDHVRPEKH
jgi:glycosyltransferase involved in cell wall biosynthesis